MRLAAIPTRGGSARMARRRIRLIGRRPTIACATAAALQAGCCDQVTACHGGAGIAGVARG
jgi:hypothetical protein